MIAKDFGPDTLAEVAYHASGRFMERTRELQVGERASRAEMEPGGLLIRARVLLKHLILSERTVTIHAPELRKCAAGPRLCESLHQRAVQLVLRARHVLKPQRIMPGFGL